jgi:hypothetical protein
MNVTQFQQPAKSDEGTAPPQQHVISIEGRPAVLIADEVIATRLRQAANKNSTFAHRMGRTARTAPDGTWLRG